MTMGICTSCACRHYSMGRFVADDTLQVTMQKYQQLNDSIFKIVRSPREIICVLGCANPIDTLRLDTIRVLPKETYPVLDFLFWNPTNFESNDIVYGNFRPSVSYIIKERRNKQVTLQFDFGLKKWRILDKDSQVVLGADLKDENLPLLRFTRTLFPKDTTLQLMNKNLISPLK